LSGYGQDGPLSRYPANGNTTEPMSGLSSINGYEGDAGANTGGLIPDPISGYYFAGAIMAALAFRQRTGKGQRIDLSMVEAVAVQLGEHIMDYTANSRVTIPGGNRHSRIAPHNVYLAADDRWVAITALDDGQWRALARIMDIRDERFTDMEGRKRHESDLDETIASWCGLRQAEEIEADLVKAGVCAAAVRRFLDVYRNPSEQFLTREYLVPVTHPESGTHHMPTLPWVLTGAKSPPVRHSPRFGEHSREVFREELEMTDEAYEDLVAEGITGTTRL
ncbi:MAG TPA: CoA transferase, partial [Alphaproteobacteria bacterium]|nr:CoA transferase [Alphaproteobacteria bacterium]